MSIVCLSASIAGSICAKFAALANVIRIRSHPGRFGLGAAGQAGMSMACLRTEQDFDAALAVIVAETSHFWSGIAARHAANLGQASSSRPPVLTLASVLRLEFDSCRNREDAEHLARNVAEAVQGVVQGAAPA